MNRVFEYALSDPKSKRKELFDKALPEIKEILKLHSVEFDPMDCAVEVGGFSSSLYISRKIFSVDDFGENVENLVHHLCEYCDGDDSRHWGKTWEEIKTLTI